MRKYVIGVATVFALLLFGVFTTSDAASTNATFPSSGTNQTGVGTVAWSNPGRIVSDNTSYAESFSTGSGTTTTNYLVGSAFGFSIPSGSTITGIVLEINRFEQIFAGDVKDNIVSIRKADGSIGSTNKASLVGWTGFDTSVATYGGSSDLWGETWSPADINDSDFGAVLSAYLIQTGPDATYADVDYMRITVYYTYASAQYSQTQGVTTLTSGTVIIP